ncbi:hypothetical protein B9T25_01490 [Acinetobacter sp. ANC 4470]|uniref:hypothetical protein n=1 Tax=Acinetobacter sp. ANC 4470 TaxID=1977881 RepID=UPI000A33A2E9|nr:hypothetical protein [Acinetobacter sp. ANC 4470]OTG69294.1 hypothetical protein B9T25_01490 [Acinetobacter sp. ANC 4470]
MLKILLWLCLFIVFIGLWKVLFKIHIHQHFQQYRNKQQEYSNKPAATSMGEITLVTETCTEDVEEYEQQLFDDICQIFFEQKPTEREMAKAITLQENALRKMPAKTKTLIRKLDLSEWSIYWTFYDQSLEYYVGRYGVFYTHVDRFGYEHKLELKEKQKA